MATFDAEVGIDGVVVVRPEVHGDDRGTLAETYRAEWFPGRRPMVQANRADRVAGAVVGLHHHLRQSDFWTVSRGRVRVVLHDLRTGSPTEGVTVHLDLGGDDAHPDHRGVLIPPGVAHGFATHSAVTVGYLVDHVYDPDDELGVAWDDPAVAADWGVADPVLSPRDQVLPRSADLPATHRPRFAG